MKTTKFAVDVDDVIRQLLCNMVELYNSEFNESLTCDDVQDYDVGVSFPKVSEKYDNVYEWFFNENAYRLFMRSEPIVGAIDAINRLYDFGEIYIVTKQSGIKNKMYTLMWLEKYGVKYDALCFVTKKSMINCDYLIDDYQENFRNMECGTGVLINAPYNENITDEYLKSISGCGMFLRYDSIEEFVNDYIKEKKNAKTEIRN